MTALLGHPRPGIVPFDFGVAQCDCALDPAAIRYRAKYLQPPRRATAGVLVSR